MDIKVYKTLIDSLPVQQQCFTTKRSTWRKSEGKIVWLAALNDKIFNRQETLNTSRQDIFHTDNVRELILKIIYWGYPAGMRGNHFINILNKIEILKTVFQELNSKDNLTEIHFRNLNEIVKPIVGLGLSTYSKLLYFFNVKFNNNPCLILDQRLIDVFASEFYNDFLLLSRVRYSNAESKYLDYTSTINKVPLDLQVKGENIEQFLFIFGNNLKKHR